MNGKNGRKVNDYIPKYMHGGKVLISSATSFLNFLRETEVGTAVLQLERSSGRFAFIE